MFPANHFAFQTILKPIGNIRLLLLIPVMLLAGCSSARNPNDPLEPLNRGIYKFNDSIDKAVIKPVAQGYSAVMPVVGKTMVSNFFSNLDDVVVTANDLLQFKLEQAFSDGTRFLVNSTVGVLGLIDVASTGGLKKHNEDFGQTLGKWGVGNGAYLVLPILGPSTIRDGVGLYADGYTSPTYQIQHMRTRNQTYLAKGVSRRAELLDQEKVLDEAMIDRYEFLRDTYLLYRKNLVYDGNPPRARYDDDEGEGNDTSQPEQPPAPSAPVPDAAVPDTVVPDSGK
jgi:phospholipid-binding lipoprotein MlaA